MAEILGKVVKPAWHIQDPEMLRASWTKDDLNVLPHDPDASSVRRSRNASLMGVLALHVEQVQRDNPHLSQAIAYLDSQGNTRMGELPPDALLGEHSNYPGYRVAAIELGHYPVRCRLGFWAYGDSFVELEEARTLGLTQIDLLRRTQPDVPVVQRLLIK